MSRLIHFANTKNSKGHGPSTCPIGSKSGPPHPPPPPPPPRSSGRPPPPHAPSGNKPSHHVSPANNMNGAASVNDTGGNSLNGDREPSNRQQQSINHNFVVSKDSTNKDNMRSSNMPCRRHNSEGDGREPPSNFSRSEGALMSPSNNGESKSNNSKVSFHKYSQVQVEDIPEDEAYAFKKFCSMSLTELESLETVVKKNIDKRDVDDSSILESHEFNDSTMSNNNQQFTPRPVRVSQFEDDEPLSSNEPSTPRGRSKTVNTITTSIFLNSIKNLPLDNNGTNNHMNTPPETTCKSPLSSKTPLDILPDNVDRKGRCIAHPNIKLFRKKILGGYELIRERCPNCEKEAPYEGLWRGRARSGSRGRGTSRGRSGSKERRRSRSRETTKMPRSRSNERGSLRQSDESASFLHVPSLHEEQNDDAFSRGSKGSKGSGSRRRAHTPPPPPPPQNETHQGNNNRPGPPLRRSRSRDGVRSLSAGRAPRRSTLTSQSVASDDSPHPADKPSVSEKVFNFPKNGLSSLHNKASSLHNKARSSSRKRSAASGHEESLASFHKNWPRGEGGSGDRGSKPSPQSNKKAVGNSDHGGMKSSHPMTTKKAVSQQSKSKFNKKTGRCKKHPSILLAKKSHFGKGWDIIRDGCPLCEPLNKGNCDYQAQPIKCNLPEGEGDFSEISKGKMTALLQGKGGNVKDGLKDAGFKNETNPKNTKPNNPDGADNRVSRMPYTTPWGLDGWYTGEVNNFGKPHGQGRMRYNTGNRTEGEWINGYSVEFLEKRGKMKGGFGTNVAPWKENNVRDKTKSSSPHQAQQYSQSNQYQAEYHQAAAPQQAVAAPQAAYQYGMAPYNPHQAGAMMPAGTWNQQPGYQYYAQSPGGQHPPPAAYHSGGYHQ